MSLLKKKDASSNESTNKPKFPFPKFKLQKRPDEPKTASANSSQEATSSPKLLKSPDQSSRSRSKSDESKKNVPRSVPETKSQNLAPMKHQYGLTLDTIKSGSNPGQLNEIPNASTNNDRWANREVDLGFNRIQKGLSYDANEFKSDSAASRTPKSIVSEFFSMGRNESSRGSMGSSDTDQSGERLYRIKKEGSNASSSTSFTGIQKKTNLKQSTKDFLDSLANMDDEYSRNESEYTSGNTWAIGAVKSKSSMHQIQDHSKTKSIDLSNQSHQSLALKDVADALNKPLRQLPPSLMEKYLQKEQIQSGLSPQSKGTSEGRNSVLHSFDEGLSVNSQSQKAHKFKSKRGSWKSVITYIICVNAWISLYASLRKRNEAVQNAPVKEADGLSFLLSTQPAKADPSLTAKIKELTSKSNRTDADIEALERLLSIRIRSFSRFTTDQRLMFCKILKYENFDGGRAIVREGHVSWAFYFIMSGQVEIYKIKNGLKYRLNVMNAGASFGDRTMNLLNDKRTASVGTTVDVELIRIEKSDFFDITNVRDEKGMANRAAKLLQISHFASAPGGFVERIAPFTQIITYEPNENIIFEGTDNYKLFFIVKGICHCTKVVPFVKRLVSSTYAGKTYKVIAHESNTVLQPDDEPFKEQLKIQELDTGDFFPDIPPPKEAKKDEDVLYINRNQYLEQLKAEDPADMSTKAYVSVVANTKVEVAAVSRVDYAEYATSDMILSIINSKSVFKVPMNKLQETYLEKRQWDVHKKKVVADVLKK